MRARRCLITALAAALALGTTGTPPASGAPQQGPGDQAPPGARPTIVRVSDRGGFDWADAGIGAAGGFALSVLGASLVLLINDAVKEGEQ
jgi:hypothetical protein